MQSSRYSITILFDIFQQMRLDFERLRKLLCTLTAHVLYALLCENSFHWRRFSSDGPQKHSQCVNYLCNNYGISKKSHWILLNLRLRIKANDLFLFRSVSLKPRINFECISLSSPVANRTCFLNCIEFNRCLFRALIGFSLNLWSL